jgi:hypothetical protein
MKSVNEAKANLEGELTQFGYKVSIHDFGEYILIHGPNINSLGLKVPRKTWNRQDGIDFVVREIKSQLLS